MLLLSYQWCETHTSVCSCPSLLTLPGMAVTSLYAFCASLRYRVLHHRLPGYTGLRAIFASFLINNHFSNSNADAKGEGMLSAAIITRLQRLARSGCLSRALQGEIIHAHGAFLKLFAPEGLSACPLTLVFNYGCQLSEYCFLDESFIPFQCSGEWRPHLCT